MKQAKEIIILNSSLSIKKYSIESLGCAKNQVDAETMIASLPGEAWEYTTNHEESDLILVNTCGFITSAKEESIDTFLSLREEYPDTKIMITGCLAERYKDELKDSLPEVDGVFGNKAPSLISEVVDSVMSGDKPVIIPTEEVAPPQRDFFLNFDKAVYVKVSEGCNHRCSFCAIPLIRGSLKSRTLDSVLTEIQALLEKGVSEINLIAQDLASFGVDLVGHSLLPDLLKEISKWEGQFWIRMLYIHPDTFIDELLSICQNDERILPYFDLPFQHCAVPVLRAMGRRGDSESYLALINKIRTALPHGVIRSTFLVGFPKEDDKSFEQLLEFQQKAQIDWLGVFPYSREEGTAAYRMQNNMTHKFMTRRAEKRKAQLENAQIEITVERVKRFIGTEMNIIIEEEVPEEGLYLGRGPIHAPEVDGLVVVHGKDLAIGQFYRCSIIKSNGLDLEAKLI
ncbi:30S ribosomal protein S12 methylthiotransferase RimO [Spirochaeta cellobiosiphila]|uniref:30S ribosomal protein S12 methylthiotransferase RimO n=1 Tax=Spirochaeta cellobiosiphila TaxID=504483 RepID=UPI00069FEBEA|nr:30S ribosomal protein S12 methylthiotransferase RimO [Spirochaeta cellobiosiphila]